MKKHKWLIFVILCIVVIGGIIFLLFPRFKIDKKEVNLGSEYTAKVKVYNIINDLTKYSSVSDNVDTSKLGIYTAEVKVKYLFITWKKKFDVMVVDRESPLITLEGNEIGIACPGKEYVEEGYTASDNYDGDITDKVKVELGDSKVIYSVSDSSNNVYKIERSIEYKDEETPIITLNGSQYLSLYVGNSYNEEGYIALDNCDGEITDEVSVSGEVNTNNVGVYTITYTVEDSSGNRGSMERYVTVKQKKTYAYGDGNIYLTFDDGPSALTGQILDILDSEGVKATFFVCGANEYTKRAYDSGNAIALHSNTHDYGYIYSSIDNYFSDLTAISDKVYNVIGIHPNIIRFPGGSSNTVSRHYSYGIMSRLTSEVENRGYAYFDWNVDSNDAGGDGANSSRIYSNVINSLSHNKTNIVLMHDSGGHYGTVNALRDIIRFGKEYGYSFRVIDSSTPPVHHGVNN